MFCSLCRAGALGTAVLPRAWGSGTAGLSQLRPREGFVPCSLQALPTNLCPQTSAQLVSGAPPHLGAVPWGGVEGEEGMSWESGGLGAKLSHLFPPWAGGCGIHCGRQVARGSARTSVLLTVMMGALEMPLWFLCHAFLGISANPSPPPTLSPFHPRGFWRLFLSSHLLCRHFPS